MEDPFLLNYRNARRPRPRFSPNAIHQQQQQQQHPPKVVSVPVRFVGSERARSEAATKIQKLFRGFEVRQKVKKIAKIRSQVDNVQHQISQNSDLIARDAKERLRLNEALMSLLFQLDSVRGVDPAVRDCRKAVIRRAIALQEALDAIAEKTVTDSVDQTAESPVESDAEPKRENQNPVESEEQTEILVESNRDESSGVDEDQALEIESEDERSVEKVEEEDGEEGIIEKAAVEEEEEKNWKLRDLVMDLCERNAEQSRLIELLSQRVHQLEKTVARCERIRRKKKKRCAGKLEREIERSKCERRW